MRKFITFFASISVAALAQADWSGQGDLGYNQVSGNSESESLAAALGAAYETGNWKHSINLDAFTASQDETRSAESYGAEFQSDYSFSEQTYAFGNLRYVTDKFSGYDSQTALTAGIGRQFIDDGITLLDGKLGAGYRMSELNTGEDEDEAIATGQLVYNRLLTDTTTFESLWLVESGSENTYAEGGVSLRVAMSEALALKVSYTVKHNTEVPEDTEKTDRYTTVTVNYKF